MSRVSTVTQRLKRRWKERFPRVKSSSFTSQFSVADSRRWSVVGEDFKCELKTSFVGNIWSDFKRYFLFY
jgi:hypothetical protein